MKIKISFIGAGKIIREHIKAFSTIKNVELQNLEHFEKAYKVICITADTDDALKKQMND